MELTYAPGACNIGADEIARLLVALPLTDAAIATIQSRRRF
jgi:hypothetical protein